MHLTEKQLRKLAKQVIDRERELMYGEPVTSDQRVAALERLVIEAEKGLSSNDTEETGR